MESLLNIIIPIIIGFGFIGFIVFQIFSKTSVVKNRNPQNILYFADSTNSGTPARNVLETTNKLNPDYLGMRDVKL